MKLSKAQKTFIKDLQDGLYTLTGLCPTDRLTKEYGWVLNHKDDRFKNRYARFSTVKKLISLGMLKCEPCNNYYVYSLTDLGQSV